MYWCGVVVVSYGAVSTCNLQVPTSRFILMVGVQSTTTGVIEPMITGSIFHLYLTIICALWIIMYYTCIRISIQD